MDNSYFIFIILVLFDFAAFLFFFIFIIQLFKTDNETINNFFSIEKIKILFNRIRHDSVTLKLSSLFSLYMFFLFIVSMFLIFLIFLAFEVSHAHAFMGAFESIYQKEFGELYTSNDILDFKLNRLQQEHFELKMSHHLLMNVLEQINLIDESTISLIKEKSLSFKEEVKILFQKENS